MLLLHDSQSAADTNLCHVQQSGHVNDKKASPRTDRLLTTGSTRREKITQFCITSYNIFNDTAMNL